MALGRRSTFAMYSGTVSQFQSMPASIASVGMSSTAVRQRANHSRSAGLHGASAKPQLPITTLVTPCQHEQLRSGPHAFCAPIMGVGVDKAGRDDQPVGIDDAISGSADPADLDDLAGADADIGAIARRPRS